MSKARFVLLILVPFFIAGCAKNEGRDTETFLKEFHENPREVMSRAPQKLDDAGNILADETVAFPRSLRGDKAFLQMRDQVREGICEQAGYPGCEGGSTSESVHSDRGLLKIFAEVDVLVDSVVEIERRNLTRAYTARSPWTESHWATGIGGIARRFGDPSYPNNSKDWMINYNYYLSVPSDTITDELHFSPAEKYDLLVGDSNWTMTKANWDLGQYYQNKMGHVPRWTGYCHGWAPASIIYAQPAKTITVRGVNGRQVTFNPSDLKALASALYAEAAPKMYFVGKRCKKYNPQEDEVGRITDENCVDTNPGSFHLALVNRVGINKRSFVFDASFDYEIWNYPVYGYRFTYFNPQTLMASKNLNESIIPKARFTIDKFAKYRSPNAKYVVGIALDLSYARGGQPSTKDGFAPPVHKTVRYIYDLELDQNKKIIGGEWYLNAHPDFVWTPPHDAKPISKGELELAAPIEWDGVSDIPAELIQAAQKSSPERQPVGAIVNTLIRLGQQETVPTP